MKFSGWNRGIAVVMVLCMAVTAASPAEAIWPFKKKEENWAKDGDPDGSVASQTELYKIPKRSKTRSLFKLKPVSGKHKMKPMHQVKYKPAASYGKKRYGIF